MGTIESYWLRNILHRFGAYDLSRTDDAEVIQQFRGLARSAYHLRSLADIDTAIAFFSWDRSLDAHGYLRLFRDAVEILSFRVPNNAGILYSGQYSLFPEYSLRAGTASGDPAREDGLRWRGINRLIDRFASSTTRMKDLALDKAGKSQKRPIDDTEGGGWLLRANLGQLVDYRTEQEIWYAASEKYVQNLSGEVEVYLAFPEFERTFRSVEGRTLFENANVSRIVYFLEHGSSRSANLPPELFGPGVVRKARGKELVFRVSKG